MAKSEVQLVALARFVGAIDPLRIHAKKHVGVGVTELSRDIRRIRAGHECKRRERVPRLIRFAVAQPLALQTAAPGFPLRLNVGPRRADGRVPENLFASELRVRPLRLNGGPGAITELDVAHEVGLRTGQRG